MFGSNEPGFKELWQDLKAISTLENFIKFSLLITLFTLIVFIHKNT